MIYEGFAITINVSPKKRIGKHGHPFEQRDDEIRKNIIIRTLMQELEKYESLTLVYSVFEYTLNNMPHLHGYIIDREPLSMQLKMEKIQYAIHRQLGFPRLEPKICCYVERTKVNQCFWDVYTVKDIDEWYKNTNEDYYEPDEEPIKINQNLFAR